MLKLKVNDKDIEIEEGLTVLQACEQAGVEIPRFCYHEKLSIAGNCRMCLVEMEKSPKPIASCAMPAAEGMNIKTNTPLVEKARKGVMEFLLANHPLDCPVCDQGGECDLQDQSMYYGIDKSRFKENKRFVPEKYMGPLIKTQMTRCIHCTRCVRFATEVAGIPEIGAIGRGEDMQITTYLEKAMESELSGNVIDLCPVGALTSKPYVFEARPWELKKTETIDVMDAVGSNIRVDTYGWEVKRVLPRINEEINEEWISDKTRYACDGLKSQRLDHPLKKINKKFKKISWKEAYETIAEKIKITSSDKIAGFIGDLTNMETMFVTKEFFEKTIKSKNLEARDDNTYINTLGALNKVMKFMPGYKLLNKFLNNYIKQKNLDSSDIVFVFKGGNIFKFIAHKFWTELPNKAMYKFIDIYKSYFKRSNSIYGDDMNLDIYKDETIPQRREGNLAKNSFGGTELTTLELWSHLPEKYKEDWRWVISRLYDDDVNSLLPKLWWFHDLSADPCHKLLSTKDGHEKFEKLIFSSHWQMMTFVSAYNVPTEKCEVMKTAIFPHDHYEKPKNTKFNLMYCSTPQRGLHVLCNALNQLERND